MSGSEMKKHRADSLAFELFICEEVVLAEQEENPEPLQIKEEQEELWTSQEGEWLQGLEEADVIRFTFNPVSVKSEHDEEKPPSSWFNQTQDPESLQVEEEQEEPFQDLEEADIIKLTYRPAPVKSEHDEEEPRSSWFNQTQGPESLRIKEEQEEPLQDLEEVAGSEMTLHSVKNEHDGENWSSQLIQTQDPELLQIKDELHQGMENHDFSKITGRSVKCEEEDTLPLQPLQREKNREAHSSSSTSIEPMKTEPDGEDCGLSEPASSLDPGGDLEPTRGGQPPSSDCSLTETDDRVDESVDDDESPGAVTNGNGDWKKSEGPGLMMLKPKKKTQEIHCLSNSRPGFGQKGDLKIHIENHTGEKLFGCSVCRKEFSRKGVLVPLFRCLVCGKGFSWKGDLKTHARTHTGEKPIGCSVCGKGFCQKGNLKTHVRTHTGEKPFSCSVCGKGFSDQANLNRHMRTHRGEKPFSCSV